MFKRSALTCVLGVVALAAAVLLFLVGHEYTTNWARWFFGLLLWLLGCAMLIAWMANVAAGVRERKSEPAPPETPEKRAAAKRVG
jgi:putative Mn2+ efflux pump MntP